MTEDYANKLEAALQFQDLMTDRLYEAGIVLVTYVSKARSIGAENRMGLEIKNDRRFRETHNLYLEVAEKSAATNRAFVPSGIYRADNSWLFAIGDEGTLWIFAKRTLQLIAQNYPPTEIFTSRGFLMPTREADRWCAKRIDFPTRPGGQ